MSSPCLSVIHVSALSSPECLHRRPSSLDVTLMMRFIVCCWPRWAFMQGCSFHHLYELAAHWLCRVWNQFRMDRSWWRRWKPAWLGLFDHRIWPPELNSSVHSFVTLMDVMSDHTVHMWLKPWRRMVRWWQVTDVEKLKRVLFFEIDVVTFSAVYNNSLHHLLVT